MLLNFKLSSLNNGKGSLPEIESLNNISIVKIKILLLRKTGVVYFQFFLLGLCLDNANNSEKTLFYNFVLLFAFLS